MMINLYVLDVKDPAHEPIVDKLVSEVVYLDNATTDEYKAALGRLDVLKELNEDNVYNHIIEDLKKDSRYQDFI